MSLGTKFHSKLLLFGEYTIIDGGSALSVPLHFYFGKWHESPSKTDLSDFFSYLKGLNGYNKGLIQKAEQANWVFKSNIPQGYGLGSSGALTAAAFEAFYTNKNLGPEEIMTELAQAESFFHGNSSGLDPMTSYFNLPILVQGSRKHVIDKIDIGESFFLLDSKIERNTKELVAWFKQKKKSDTSFENALTKLNKLNELAISSILCSNTSGIHKAMKAISILQYEHFKRLIPEHIFELWSKGIKDEAYYIKLSGAGGGGCFLAWGDSSSLSEQNDVLKIK